MIRSSHGRCSLRKVLIEILQNSQETTCARVSFLITLQVCLRPAALSKKRLWHKRFPVNFAKFLRTHFSENTSWRLLLNDKKMLSSYIKILLSINKHETLPLLFKLQDLNPSSIVVKSLIATRPT